MKAEELKKELLSIKRSIDNVIKSLDDFDDLESRPQKEVASEHHDFMELVVSTWNDGVGAKCTLNETVKRNLRARLRNKYSESDILKAVKNRITFVNNSEFHNEPRNRVHKVNIGLVIRNDQELEKYMNMYSQQEMFEIKEKTIGIKKESNTSMLD